jgi:hypothetical protein
MIPVLAFPGALISAIFFEINFSPTILRSKTGVPLWLKKWNPRIGKLPKPGMVNGEFGIRAEVSGWKAAMGGICEAVEDERRASGVTSYKVATAPRATGGEERLDGQV